MYYNLHLKFLSYHIRFSNFIFIFLKYSNFFEFFHPWPLSLLLAHIVKSQPHWFSCNPSHWIGWSKIDGTSCFLFPLWICSPFLVCIYFIFLWTWKETEKHVWPQKTEKPNDFWKIPKKPVRRRNTGPLHSSSSCRYKLQGGVAARSSVIVLGIQNVRKTMCSYDSTVKKTWRQV